VIARAALLSLLCGCATLSGARPLDQGEHAVGVTLGGAMLTFSGAPMPLPNAVVEGRSGLAPFAGRPTEVSYGLDATGLVFGILPLHAGLSWQFTDQRKALPAFTLTDRLWFATNAIGLGLRADPKLQAWASNQIEVDASWLVGRQLLYLGLATYADLGSPRLNLTPLGGVVFDFAASRRGLLLQLEARWYAANVPPDLDLISWIPARGNGALGVTLGFGYRFGGEG
jgi:hypothetical protein